MPTLIWSKVKDGLDPSMKKKAYAFFEKLQDSDELPGLHIEPIVGSVDPRVRTGRVDDNFRCVLFKITSGNEPFYVIHGVWPHDKANRIAESIRLSMNPINGVPEVERVLDEIRTQGGAPKPPPAPEPSPAVTFESRQQGTPPIQPSGAARQAPLWPTGLSVEVLHDVLGIDADLAAAALAAPTDEALDAVIQGARVEWQGTALLELATGTSVDELRSSFRLDETPAPPDEDTEDARLIRSLEHPAAKASFHWIDDNAELRRVIEAGDLGAWRVFLHPEQRAYVEGDRQGTFRLSGGPRGRVRPLWRSTEPATWRNRTRVRASC